MANEPVRFPVVPVQSSVLAAHPQIAVSVETQIPHMNRAERSRITRNGFIQFEGFVPPIISENTLPINPDPQIARRIAFDGADLPGNHIAPLRRHVEFPEIFGFRIINVNTDIGPDPDQAIGIFVQYPDEIIPDRHRVGGIVFEYPEPVAVIPRQPVFRSQPNEPEMILQYAAHRILAQPVFHSDMGKVQIIGKRNLRRQMRTIKQYNE